MDRRIIAVVGMHRSGTSLMTRGLQALGADLGEQLLPADAHNPTGYWEDTSVLALNYRVLEAQGLRWNSPCLQPKRVRDEAAFQEEACDLIRKLVGAAQLIGVKDPRMSRLLWFWQPVFRMLELEPSYVLSVRDPREVARSLQARSPISLSQAYLLWALHYLDLFDEVKDQALVAVDYGDLVADPRSTLRRVAHQLALPRPLGSEEAIELFAGFVDQNLRRQRGGGDRWDHSDPITKAVAELYRALSAVARDELTLESAGVLEAMEKMRELVAGDPPSVSRSETPGIARWDLAKS